MIIQFPTRTEELDDLVEALDTVFGNIERLSEQLDYIENEAMQLQEMYDRQLKALAHRVGGLERVPVEYLLYTSLDTEILEILEKLQWKTEETM